jgi:hypothetical protein
MDIDFSSILVLYKISLVLLVLFHFILKKYLELGAQLDDRELG